MRPTTPLASWRIAVDLEATARVQNQPGMPAHGCQCECCSNWARAWPNVLPKALREQLQRLRVDLAHPSDLYASQELPGGAHCRLIYHVVGKLLSGPPAWREDPELGRMLVYHSIPQCSPEIGLVVVASDQTFDARPKLEAEFSGALIQVDLRLYVPHAPKNSASLERVA